MAARSLGALTLDLLVRLGGFQKGMDAAARISEKRMKEIQATAKKVGLAIGAALTASAAGLVAFVQSQASAIASYQDIAEKIGDTAEAVASLKTAADVSETSLDTVATAAIKLTAALSKTDDEGKGVGAALKAIGISIEDFKKQSPVEQIDAIARALAGFENGANKTAVAVALFGKSGAELLPFLNDLADGAERNITLTQQQIDAANEFSETLAGLKGQAGTLSQQFAAELIPVALDVLKVFVDLIREVKVFGGDNSVREFAQSAAIGFAVVGESVVGLIKLLNAVRGSFQSVFADIRLLAELARKASPVGAVMDFASGGQSKGLKELLDNRNKVAEEANQRYVDLFTYNGTQVSDALRKTFDEQKNYVEKVAGLAKPELKFSGIPPETVKNTKAATDAMKDYAFEVRKAQDAEEKERNAEAQEILNRSIADARSVFESTRTPLEKFNAEIERLNKLRDTFVDGKPLIDDVTYRRAVVAAQDDLHSLGETTKEVADEMSVFWEQAARNMQDALADFLFDPFENGLKGMIQGFERALRQMIAQAAAAQIFNAFASGFSGSGGFLDGLLSIGGGLGGSTPIGGARALGGPVSPGKAYLVGEEGPEWMIPTGAGTILPNGAGNTYNINVPISAPRGTVSRETRQQVAAAVDMGIRRASARNN